jgi:hypothetical protein
MDVMPKKVPLLLYGFIAFATMCLLFLIQQLRPEMIWDLGDALWIWGEDAIVLSILNWVLLIILIITVLLGLPLILVSRYVACALLAIAGVITGILLYGALFVLPFFYW